MDTQRQEPKLFMNHKDQEMILVVKRDILFATEQWQGLKEACFDHYLSIIQKHKEFIPRGLAETDESYKQIIPYLVFEHEETYFLMQRSSTASEKRLQDKYSLGIGGHVRQEDLTGDSIFDWARREFYEEINYTSAIAFEPVGIINDDSDSTGRVHCGFVFLVKGLNSSITIKSELKSGSLMPLEECMQYNKQLESWSKLVLSFLLDKKYGSAPAKCCCH